MVTLHLENLWDKGCVVLKELVSEPFFDGTICTKEHLKRVSSFTAQDDVQMAALDQQRTALVRQLDALIPLEIQKTFPGCDKGIARSGHFYVDWEWLGKVFKQFDSEHRYKELRKLIATAVQLYELEEKSSPLALKAQCYDDVIEYEASLYEGRLYVHLAFGCFYGDAGEHTELLNLRGEVDVVAKVWELVALRELCRRCEQRQTLAVIRQTGNGLCPTCEAERKAKNFQTEEEEREWFREIQMAKAQKEQDRAEQKENGR